MQTAYQCERLGIWAVDCCITKVASDHPDTPIDLWRTNCAPESVCSPKFLECSVQLALNVGQRKVLYRGVRSVCNAVVQVVRGDVESI